MIVRGFSDNHRLLIFETPDQLADYAAGFFLDFSDECIKGRERFACALSGGSTPVLFYKEISRCDRELDLDKMYVFVVDERLVPFDHPDSNSGMIYRNLVKPFGLREGNFHPFQYLENDPEESSKRYENKMRSFFPESKSFPVLDLMVLGVGDDGHTASLFPGQIEVTQPDSWVAASGASGHPLPRMTLTMPVIVNSRRIMLLATGEKKSKMVKTIVKDGAPELPVSKVWKGAGSIDVLVDEKAADSLLELV